MLLDTASEIATHLNFSYINDKLFLKNALKTAENM